MSSIFSPNRNYELQATGSHNGTWGVTANADFSIIDLNLGGRLNINAAGSSNVTVSTTQARNVFHNITGVLTGNIQYILPAEGMTYILSNQTTGAFTITAICAGGTGIVIPQGEETQVFINPDTLTAIPLTATPSTEPKNLVFAGPASGSDALPTFRALVTADVPTTFQANTFTGGQRTNSTALTSSSNSTAIDFSLNNDYTASLTENTTFANPSNIVAGQKGRVAITQNASAAKTVAYGSFYKFPGGNTPSVSTILSAVDVLYYDVVTTTFIVCNLVKGFA